MRITIPRTLILFATVLMSASYAKSQTAASAAKPSHSTLPIAVSGHEERLAAAIIERVKSFSPKTDNVGNVYVRNVRVVGDELIVQLPTTAADGTAVTRTNTFSRIG